jgi:hypothetical protein
MIGQRSRPASRGLRSEPRCLPMTRRRREITGLSTVPQIEQRPPGGDRAAAPGRHLDSGAFGGEARPDALRSRHQPRDGDRPLDCRVFDRLSYSDKSDDPFPQSATARRTHDDPDRRATERRGDGGSVRGLVVDKKVRPARGSAIKLMVAPSPKRGPQNRKRGRGASSVSRMGISGV